MPSRGRPRGRGAINNNPTEEYDSSTIDDPTPILEDKNGINNERRDNKKHGFKKSNNFIGANEEQNKSSGNSRGYNTQRGTITHQHYNPERLMNDTQKPASFRGRGGYKTQRGPYRPPHKETSETSAKTHRVKSYHQKNQQSESKSSNFQIIASNDNEEDEEYTQQPTRNVKRPFKKPNPKDLVWERPIDKETDLPTQKRFNKQPIKKPNPKDLVWERPVDQKLKFNSTPKTNNDSYHTDDSEPIRKSNHQKNQQSESKSSNFQIVASNDNEEDEEYTQQPTRNVKRPFKKPNPKDLVWERPIDKETDLPTQKRFNKQPIKKPNPKDLVWERPIDKETDLPTQERFNKQPIKKPNPKDLVWERPVDNDNSIQPQRSTGIRKYFDDLFQAPNTFSLPQGFSGFASYRHSGAVSKFEIPKPKIEESEDDEEINDNEENYQDEDYNEMIEQDENDDQDEEQDNGQVNNFTIERNVSSDEEKGDTNEKENTIITQKTHEKIEKIEKIDKDVIYLKLKTMEFRSKIWSKSYPPKANTIIGTCQDKCPKQEIINREKENDLSPFERTGKVIINEKGIKIHKADHASCVKKYSRSAAGVSEDPSHIRPPIVLKKTLEYLTNNVLTRSEEYHAIYFFVRDRVRSITQDLKRQNINDERSVDLHEIISRFYIMSHHLLADLGEELSDSHLNLEQLGNCLKTLRERYTDLRLNNVDCPNEAEFTAYYILLSITSDQGVAKCLRNLPPRLIKCPDVLFALKVYNAFSTRNYVRFFELIKEATYLNACIMHIYFTSVREEALSIMNRAFYLKVNDISKAGKYPIAKLVDILAFESERECIDFCKACGLVIDGDDILFNFAEFTSPEPKLKAKRSFKLIESKVIGVSYSDIVNFRIAPETVKIPPKVSEITSTELPNKKKQPKQTTPTQPTIDPTIFIEPAKTAPPLLTNQSSTQNLSVEDSTPGVKLSNTKQTPMPIPYVNVINPPNVWSSNQPSNTADCVPQKFIEKYVQPQLPVTSKFLSDQAFPTTKISSPLPPISISPIKTIVPTEDEIKKEVKRKYFTLLKKFATRKSQLREIKKQHLCNARDFVLKNNQEKTIEDENDGQPLVEFYKHAYKKRHLSNLYQPVDLGSLIFNSSFTDKYDIFTRFFWKLLVVTGNNSPDLNEWIESKLSFPGQGDDYLCNFVVSGKDVESHPPTKKNIALHLCARIPTDSRSWRGTSSVIFILNDPNNMDIQTYFTLEKKRMHEHFSNLGQFQNLSIPILILYENSYFNNITISEVIFKETILGIIYEDFKCFSNVVCESFNLTNLYNFPSKEDICIANQILENYITWLANNSSGPPLLYTYSIRDLLEESTFSHFRRLLSEIDTSDRNSISVKDFILAYNDVCEAFSNQVMLEMERMRKVNWPAPEFEKYDDWNTDENSILQKELLGQLSLPTIDLSLYNSKHLFDNLFNTCKQYVITLFNKRNIYNPTISSSTINQLIIEMVNGGGSSTSSKIFEFFLEIHLDLLFDRDPLYSILFTTTEFNKITRSVFERLGFCNNTFISSKVRISSISLKHRQKEAVKPFRNLKRATKEASPQQYKDCKKRKVVSYVDVDQCLEMYSKLTNKIKEQQDVWTQLKTNSHYYQFGIQDAMSDESSDYQSCIDSLKMLKDKLEKYRNDI